jgi:hypothetical protein
LSARAVFAMLCALLLHSGRAQAASSWYVPAATETAYICSNPNGYVIGTLFANEGFYRPTAAAGRSDNPAVQGYIWGWAHGTANLSGWICYDTARPYDHVLAGGSASSHGPLAGERYEPNPAPDSYNYLRERYAAFVNVPDGNDGTEIQLLNRTPIYGNYNVATGVPSHPYPITLEAGDYVKWRWVSKDLNMVMVGLRSGYPNMPARGVAHNMWVFMPRSAFAGDHRSAPVQPAALRADISPAEVASAGAQWQVDGGPWQNSGTNLLIEPAYHTLAFKPVLGWNTPASKPFGVTTGAGIAYTGVYTPQPGAIQVQVGPERAAAEGGRWQVDGGAWQSSGAVVAVARGAHTVSFAPVRNWDTPAPQSVTINPGQAIVSSGLYVAQPASLRMTITPPGAVTAGGSWQIDGGPWRASWSASRRGSAFSERPARWPSSSTRMCRRFTIWGAKGMITSLRWSLWRERRPRRR